MRGFTETQQSAYAQPHPDLLYYLRFIMDSDIYYLFFILGCNGDRETIRLDRSSVGVADELYLFPVSVEVSLDFPKSTNCTHQSGCDSNFSYLEVAPEV